MNLKLPFLLQSLVSRLHRSSTTILIILLNGLRPLLGPTNCPYTISCTRYASWALANHGMLVAFRLIIQRLLACTALTNPANRCKDRIKQLRACYKRARVRHTK